MTTQENGILRNECDSARSGVNRSLMLFDGVCRLCNGWARFIIRYDRRQQIQLASMQSSIGQSILRDFGMPTDRFDTLLYIENSRAYTKSDAIIRILDRLGGPWRAATIFQVIPRRWRDRLYDAAACRRYRLLGRYRCCTYPEADHERRFLDDRHSG